MSWVANLSRKLLSDKTVLGIAAATVGVLSSGCGATGILDIHTFNQRDLVLVNTPEECPPGQGRVCNIRCSYMLDGDTGETWTTGAYNLCVDPVIVRGRGNYPAQYGGYPVQPYNNGWYPGAVPGPVQYGPSLPQGGPAPQSYPIPSPPPPAGPSYNHVPAAPPMR